MAVVDTLVTRYVMDNADYKRGAQDITQATSAISGQIGKAQGLFTGLKVVSGLLGGGIIAAGAMAFKSASDWEVLVKQLSVVTGSMERASQVAKFAEKLAGPSAFFDTQQLAEAAKLLETMQLNTERFLPLVSTMASLFGGSTESLMQFTSALGKLRSGVFGEAFERMREFGISMDDLRKQGLQFSKSGEFQLFDTETTTQGAERALGAVERIIKTRFGTLDSTMQDSMSARFTSLFDAMGRGAKTVGLAIMDRVKKPFSEFVAAFEGFVGSGMFQQAADNLAAAFDFEKIKDSAIRMLSTMVAGFKQLPSIITGIQSMLGTMWKVATQAAVLYVSIQAAAFGAEAARAGMAMVSVFQGMQAAAIGTAAATGATQAMLKNLAAISIGLLAGTAVFVGLQKMLQSIPGAAGGAIGFDENAFNADRNRVEQAILGNPSGSAGNSGSAFADAAQQAIGMGGAGSEMSQQTNYLASIERNTRPIKNSILGGGDLAAMGVTPVELSGIKSGRGGKIAQAVSLISQAVSEESARTTAWMMRQSAIIPGR